MEIEKEDKPKTAFQVGTLGFYEFHRTPFGLCNAPATFQRLMEMCMGDMNLRDCLVYLDGIIIFSSTFQEHIDRFTGYYRRFIQNFARIARPLNDLLIGHNTFKKIKGKKRPKIKKVPFV